MENQTTIRSHTGPSTVADLGASTWAFPFGHGVSMAIAIYSRDLWGKVFTTVPGDSKVIKHLAKRCLRYNGPIHSNDLEEIGRHALRLLEHPEYRASLFAEFAQRVGLSREIPVSSFVASRLYKYLHNTFKQEVPPLELIATAGRERGPSGKSDNLYFFDRARFAHWLDSTAATPEVMAQVGAAFAILEPEVGPEIGALLASRSPGIEPLLRRPKASSPAPVPTVTDLTLPLPAVSFEEPPAVVVASATGGTAPGPDIPPRWDELVGEGLRINQEFLQAATSGDFAGANRLMMEYGAFERSFEAWAKELEEQYPGLRVMPLPRGSAFDGAGARNWPGKLSGDIQHREQVSKQELESNRARIEAECKRRALPVPEDLYAAADPATLATIEGRLYDTWRVEDAWADAIGTGNLQQVLDLGREAARVLLDRALSSEAHLEFAARLLASMGGEVSAINMADALRLLRGVGERAKVGTVPPAGFWRGLLASTEFDLDPVFEETSLYDLLIGGFPLAEAELEAELTRAGRPRGRLLGLWANGRAAARAPLPGRVELLGRLCLESTRFAVPDLVQSLVEQQRYGEAFLLRVVAGRSVLAGKSLPSDDELLHHVLVEASTKPERHEVLTNVLPSLHGIASSPTGLMVLLFAYGNVQPAMVDTLIQEFQEMYETVRSRHPIWTDEWLFDVLLGRLDRQALKERTELEKRAHVAYSEWQKQRGRRTIYGDWRGPVPQRMQELFNRRLQEMLGRLDSTSRLLTLPDPEEMLEEAIRQCEAEFKHFPEPDGPARTQMLHYLGRQLERLETMAAFAPHRRAGVGLADVLSGPPVSFLERLNQEANTVARDPLVGRLYALARQGVAP